MMELLPKNNNKVDVKEVLPNTFKTYKLDKAIVIIGENEAYER